MATWKEADGGVDAPTGAGSRADARWRVLGVAAVALAGLLAFGGWTAVRDARHRDYRPTTGAGETLGLDVSHYQNEIDWPAVASDGIDFVFIKSTEAGDWVDWTFETNWRGARDAGLSVGAYHFFTLCRTGADQAANFLRVVPFEESDLPPAVDLEFPNNCARRPPVEELHHELTEFLDTIEQATGRTVLLYVEDEFDDMYAIFDAFDQPTWERSLRSRPEDDRWVVWQASDVARIDGIDGGVDLNLMSTECCP